MKQLNRDQTILTHHHAACHTLARFSGLPLTTIVAGLAGCLKLKPTMGHQHQDHFSALQTVARFAGIDYAQAAAGINGNTDNPVTSPEVTQRSAA